MTLVDSSTPTMHRGLANLDDEHSYWLESTSGTVPDDLKGTFVRNGPGRQKIGDTPYGHWFDGCGMLSVFSIAERPTSANRWPRSTFAIICPTSSTASGTTRCY